MSAVRELARDVVDSEPGSALIYLDDAAARTLAASFLQRDRDARAREVDADMASLVDELAHARAKFPGRLRRGRGCPLGRRVEPDRGHLRVRPCCDGVGC